MKISILLIFLIFIGCNSKQNTSFTIVDCNKEEMPKYDGKKVSLLDKNSQPYKDTIIEKIEKRRTVFKPCRDYVYDAIYSDENNELITKTRIKMTALGKRWEFQPEIQDVIVVQYEYTFEDMIKAKKKKNKINIKLPDSDWIQEVQEGIIENVDEIWMHPFRFNQFSFTEVAPFPKIKFPLKIGKKWFGQLSIKKGWGDWENTSGNFKYEIVSKRDIEIPFGTLKNCWEVKSESTYPFGKSKFNYWFNEEFGFVKMVYKNYKGQNLNIELEEIIER